jgi:hypothetical protein
MFLYHRIAPQAVNPKRALTLYDTEESADISLQPSNKRRKADGPMTITGVTAEGQSLKLEQLPPGMKQKVLEAVAGFKTFAMENQVAEGPYITTRNRKIGPRWIIGEQDATRACRFDTNARKPCILIKSTTELNCCLLLAISAAPQAPRMKGIGL